MSNYDILKKAHSLITTALTEEGLFGEGEGANYIVFDHAEQMVLAYEQACADGTISNEPIIVKE
jgi:hypothetical protein